VSWRGNPADRDHPTRGHGQAATPPGTARCRQLLRDLRPDRPAVRVFLAARAASREGDEDGVPSADQLISVDCAEALAGVLSSVAPRRPWTATRAVAASLPGMALSERARAVRDALINDLPGR